MELAQAAKLSLEDQHTREAQKMHLLEELGEGERQGLRPEVPPSRLGGVSGSEMGSDSFFLSMCSQARTHNFQDAKAGRGLGARRASWRRGGRPRTWLSSPKAAPKAAATAMLTSDPKLAGKDPGGRGSRGPQGKYSPEEVVLAVELAFPGEALLCQVAFTFTALDALDVPGPVQHVQEEAVQDGPFAAGTVHHGLWFGWVRPGERRVGRAKRMTLQVVRQELPSPSKKGRFTWRYKQKPAPENQREGGGWWGWGRRAPRWSVQSGSPRAPGAQQRHRSSWREEKSLRRARKRLFCPEPAEE